MDLPPAVGLPTTEHPVTFADGSVSVLSVHPDESLVTALADLLRAAGSEPDRVVSVERLRSFVLDGDPGEGPAGGGRQRGDADGHAGGHAGRPGD